MSEFTGICDSQCVHKGLLLIRVRGFPARDILSLCALGDGIGQDNKIVGASPSASTHWAKDRRYEAHVLERGCRCRDADSPFDSFTNEK